MNRAVAVAGLDGPHAGLGALASVDLGDYYLFAPTCWPEPARPPTRSMHTTVRSSWSPTPPNDASFLSAAPRCAEQADPAGCVRSTDPGRHVVRPRAHSRRRPLRPFPTTHVHPHCRWLDRDIARSRSDRRGNRRFQGHPDAHPHHRRRSHCAQPRCSRHPKRQPALNGRKWTTTSG